MKGYTWQNASGMSFPVLALALALEPVWARALVLVRAHTQ